MALASYLEPFTSGPLVRCLRGRDCRFLEVVLGQTRADMYPWCSLSSTDSKVTYVVGHTPHSNRI